MELTQARRVFLDQLFKHGLFIPTGVRGFYGRGQVFENIVQGFGRLVDRYSRDDGAERIYFPPLVPRSALEKTSYLESMPHLAGVVHSFCGDDAGHRRLLAEVESGGEWGRFLEMTDLALAPAACYPLYPTCTGTLREHGRTVDLDAGYVFRREPSDDPARLQMFRQREMVRLGTPEMVGDWREMWIERAQRMLGNLGLETRLQVASDPFFGRGGRMMSATQKQQKLKFELQVPIVSEEAPTAVTSFNYHTSHFGDAFGIKTQGGDAAHTACLGFGVERISLALLKRHGMDVDAWPSGIREQLR
ncbi:MAG: amino acid--[acyl-carrier-protein] ligase [Nannocystaceae bacterium]